LQPKTVGAAASDEWLRTRGLRTTEPHWYVEITVPSDVEGTRLEINIYPEEWGFVVRHGSRVSAIRITDLPFAHSTDDLRLLAEVPTLENIGDLIDGLELRLDVSFHRMRPLVRSNIAKATAAVRSWMLGARHR
jgi:hypothetical protein